MEIHLFKTFPVLKDRIPFIPLGRYPTPVQKLSSFGRRYGMTSLWIKRDDLSSEEYGGNKVRKLEFLLAEAREKRRSLLIAVGAAGSNYVTATGIYGKKLGFNVTAVLFHQPPTDYLCKNLLVNLANGVDMNLSSSMVTVPLTEVRCIIKNGFKNTYITPPGGSSALSTLGYVNAALELKEQIANGLLPEPDFIFLPLGTGGTMAGLVSGCKLAGLKTRVVGIRVVDRIISNSFALKKYSNGSISIIKSFVAGLKIPKVRNSDFIILHDYFGRGYAHYTSQGVELARSMYELEGITLEGTYTGKTLAGLIGFVKKNSLHSSNVLFWNTYNSRDLTRYTHGQDYRKLPPAFHGYFEGKIQKIFDEVKL